LASWRKSSTLKMTDMPVSVRSPMAAQQIRHGTARRAAGP
jgi:hypothetical protein